MTPPTQAAPRSDLEAIQITFNVPALIVWSLIMVNVGLAIGFELFVVRFPKWMSKP